MESNQGPEAIRRPALPGCRDTTWNCNRAAMRLSREILLASIAVHLAGEVDRPDIPNKAVTEICAAARPILFAGHGEEVVSMLAAERAQHDDAGPDAHVWNQVLEAVCTRLAIGPGATRPALVRC